MKQNWLLFFQEKLSTFYVSHDWSYTKELKVAFQIYHQKVQSMANLRHLQNQNQNNNDSLHISNHLCVIQQMQWYLF